MHRGRTIASAMGAALLATLGAACSAPADPPPAPPPAMARPEPPAAMEVARRTIAADLPMLPPGSLTARPIEVVRAVYEFAARHPEVLKYVPCFCGCERPGMNHKGNDDCFVAKRDASGHVTEWEAHGMVCEICLDVGQMAMQMHNSGASAWAIRQAVEKQFASPDKGHTPTPMPAHSGKGMQP